MSVPIQVSLAETNGKGRYEARVAGHDEVGELTFSRANPKLVIADHNGVPDSLRGMHVGQALVERLVADARGKASASFRCAPSCGPSTSGTRSGRM